MYCPLEQLPPRLLFDPLRGAFYFQGGAYGCTFRSSKSLFRAMDGAVVQRGALKKTVRLKAAGLGRVCRAGFFGRESTVGNLTNDEKGIVLAALRRMPAGAKAYIMGRCIFSVLDSDAVCIPAGRCDYSIVFSHDWRNLVADGQRQLAGDVVSRVVERLWENHLGLIQVVDLDTGDLIDSPVTVF